MKFVLDVSLEASAHPLKVADRLLELLCNTELDGVVSFDGCDPEIARHEATVSTDESDAGHGLSRARCSCGARSDKGSFTYCNSWIADHMARADNA